MKRREGSGKGFWGEACSVWIEGWDAESRAEPLAVSGVLVGWQWRRVWRSVREPLMRRPAETEGVPFEGLPLRNIEVCPRRLSVSGNEMRFIAAAASRMPSVPMVTREWAAAMSRARRSSIKSSDRFSTASEIAARSAGDRLESGGINSAGDSTRTHSGKFCAHARTSGGAPSAFISHSTSAGRMTSSTSPCRTSMARIWIR
jgi:hypothetical protein